jgi:glycosyltransferase involved in cell wall biosynthesis
MPSVDIIIPNYQYGHFLSACVESVLGQDVRDIRVLIIDNASTDNSLEVARSLAAEDNRIQIVEHAVNLGHTASFNEGIDLATADYFMILCADDLLTPGCLTRAIAVMEMHPALSFAYGDGVVCRSGGTAPTVDLGQAPTQWQISTSNQYIEKCCRAPMRSAGFLLIRTTVQKQAGHYRPELPFGDDLEMLLRLARLGPVAETKAVQGIWREHGSNRSKIFWADSMRRLRAAELTFETFFFGEGGTIDGAARLRRQARRTLGNCAYWSAVSHLIRGHFREGISLFGLAFGLSPLATVVPPVAHLFQQGRSFARVREVVWEAVRGSRVS